MNDITHITNAHTHTNTPYLFHLHFCLRTSSSLLLKQFRVVFILNPEKMADILCVLVDYLKLSIKLIIKIQITTADSRLNYCSVDEPILLTHVATHSTNHCIGKLSEFTIYTRR